MANITDIRLAGTDLTLIKRGIYEPLAAPEPLRNKLGRFGEQYDLSNSSYLYRFILALCGETGAGGVKKNLLYPRLQSALDSTNFEDLDALYGNPISLPRLSAEIYSTDPKNEALTQAQWQEVRIKDAAYRSRCLIWMRAIIEGPTAKGLALAGEAACGVECDVYEQYQYVNNAASDRPVSMSNLGVTNSRNEIIIIPRTTTLLDADRRRISHLCDKLRPVNTILTIFTQTDTRTDRTARAVVATSEGYSVQRYVTGRPEVSWPPTDPAQGLWITTTEKEAPTFAYVDRQEAVTYLTIQDVTATSTQVGPFSKEQTQLFGHLQGYTDPFYDFSASNSYAKSFAPIQLTSPWINRG
jgi:hypothetical protein